MTPGNVGLSGWTLDLARLATTFVLAAVSHRLVEVPIRRSTTRLVAVWALVGIASVGGLFVAVTAGAKPIPNYLGGRADPNGRCAEESAQSARAASAYYASTTKGVPPEAAMRGSRILVIGDSTACSLVVGFDAIGNANGLTIGNGTVVGCGVVSEKIAGAIPESMRVCGPKTQQAEAAAFAATRPDTVIWTSSWERLSLAKGRRVSSPAAGHGRTSSTRASWRQCAGSRRAARASCS